MKLFIDSNIFIRFATSDNQEMYQQSSKLIDIIRNGEINTYTSNIVLAEIQFVLLKTYKFPKKTVVAYLKDIISIRDLTVIEKTNSTLALEYYSKLNIKFGDCLIATQIPPKTILCTYDTDFSVIPHLQVATPEKILKIHKPRKY